MRRGRIFFYLAFILVLGLVGAFIVWQRYFQPSQTGVEEGPAPTPVVDLVDVIVVTQTIPRGTSLDETVLDSIAIPRELFIQGMFTDMAQVVGRLAKFDLDSGIPLTASMLVSSAEQLSTTGSVAALTIPRGYVAVSVPISRLSSVSYAPRPGDHVSVIMTMMFVDLDSEYQSILPNQISGVLAPGPGVIIGTNVFEGTEQLTSFGEQSFQTWGDAELNILSSFITAQVAAGGALAVQGRTEVDSLLNELFFVVPSERQRARLVSQTLLNDVMVLQVGDFSLPEEEKAQEPSEELAQAEEQVVSQQQETPGEVVQPEEPKPPDVITLVVTPQDAVTINYLIYSGAELTLALRAAGDDSVVDTEAATLQYLLDEYNVPVPAKLPYGMEPRQDELNPPVLENDAQPQDNQ
jgi:pilus assembly protein CpaB